MKRETLIGNYGPEADKLVYHLLKSGDFLSKVDSELLNSDYKALSSVISDKALRYDLTIPFARYISKINHQSIFHIKDTKCKSMEAIDLKR